MIDQVKLSQIKQLVQTSNILTPQEKTDWLSLTSLMNDKQLAELEEILKQPAALAKVRPMGDSAPSPAIPQSSAKPGAMSHISNMPSKLSHQRSSPVPGRITPMAEPSSAPPEPEPLVVPRTSTRVRPMGRDDDNVNLAIERLEDVSGVSADVLGGSYRAEFYQKLVKLVNQHGYFQVLARIEESPLYHDYLEFGQQKLSGRTSATLPLSQEEFEFVTDLLLALKVNRL